MTTGFKDHTSKINPTKWTKAPIPIEDFWFKPKIQHKITKVIVKSITKVINMKIQESIKSNNTKVLVTKWKLFEKLFKSKTTMESREPQKHPL